METMHTTEPAILLIATSGVEVDLLRPARAAVKVHFGQTWRPVRCACGSVHRACDPARMTVLVGKPQVGVHADPRAFRVRIVPEGVDPGGSECQVFAPAPGTDFGPWAAALVGVLADCWLGADQAVVRQVRKGLSVWPWHFEFERGTETLDELAERLVRRLLPIDPTSPCYLALRVPPGTSAEDVDHARARLVAALDGRQDIVPFVVCDESATEREVSLVFGNSRGARDESDLTVTVIPNDASTPGTEASGESGCVIFDEHSGKQPAVFSLPCFTCGREIASPGWMVIGNVAFLAREDADAPFVTERGIACNQVCANCVQAERLRAVLTSSDRGYRADVCVSCGASPDGARGWVVGTDEIHLFGPADDVNVAGMRRIGSWCKGCFARHDIESRPPADWSLPLR